MNLTDNSNILIPELAILTKEQSCFLSVHWNKNKSFDQLYTEFNILKRSGGTRLIEVPAEALKEVQKEIQNKIDHISRYSKNCHGFIKGRSTKTNALQHVGQDIVINMDIQSFFHSIGAACLYPIFASLGRTTEEVEFMCAVCTRYNRLPQGAPSSPALSNLYFHRIDTKLEDLSNDFGATYTRYADDLTFSGSVGIQKIIPKVRSLLLENGFRINERKTRILRRASRQEVTGLVVNDRVSLPRHIRKKLRAAIHYSMNGRKPFWGKVSLSDNELQGHINFATSIHPELKALYTDKYTCNYKDYLVVTLRDSDEVLVFDKKIQIEWQLDFFSYSLLQKKVCMFDHQLIFNFAKTVHFDERKKAIFEYLEWIRNNTKLYFELIKNKEEKVLNIENLFNIKEDTNIEDHRINIFKFIKGTSLIKKHRNGNGFYIDKSIYLSISDNKKIFILDYLKNIGFKSLGNLNRYRVIYTPLGYKYGEKISFVKISDNYIKNKNYDYDDGEPSDRLYSEDCSITDNWLKERSYTHNDVYYDDGLRQRFPDNIEVNDDDDEGGR